MLSNLFCQVCILSNFILSSLYFVNFYFVNSYFVEYVFVNYVLSTRILSNPEEPLDIVVHFYQTNLRNNISYFTKSTFGAGVNWIVLLLTICDSHLCHRPTAHIWLECRAAAQIWITVDWRDSCSASRCCWWWADEQMRNPHQHFWSTCTFTWSRSADLRRSHYILIVKMKWRSRFKFNRNWLDHSSVHDPAEE